jgi:hypothetical protein
MTLERFRTSSDEFDLLDLRAHFHFKSETSAGFQLGSIPKGQHSYIVFGALQVHHPCTGHIRAQLYVQLPRRYADPQLLRQLCQATLRELGIPADETYELHYSDAAHRLEMSQRVNREGLVDAM